MRYVCVLSTNDYLEGVLVLNENLKQMECKYKLLCLINQNITEETKEILKHFKIEYKVVQSIDYNSEQGRWKYTFDKINLFALTEFKKIVYLDSDFIILDNIDELFDIDVFSMASDVPCSNRKENSAIMVIKPNMDDFNNLKELVKIADKQGNGGSDQTIIRDYFKNINIIDDAYNEMRLIDSRMEYFYDPFDCGYKQKHLVNIKNRTTKKVKVVHYILEKKPWLISEPYEDEYYYDYKKMLDIVRKEKRKFLVSKKKLLIISYINALDDKVITSLNSLINQTKENLKIVLVDGNNCLKDYMKTIKKKNVVCVNEITYDEKLYKDYDYIGVFEPIIKLRNDCYQLCVEKLFDYNFDSIQFNFNLLDALSTCYAVGNENVKNFYLFNKNQFNKLFKIDIAKKSNNFEDYLNKIESMIFFGESCYEFLD